MMPDRAKSPGQSTDVDCPVFLSPRQKQALVLAACGLTDIEAARRMDVAPRTVRFYLQEARRRLNASNTTHAVAIALMARLINLETKISIEGAASAAPPEG